MSWSKCMDYGVIKVDSKKVYLFETQTQKETIQVGEEVKDARWNGNTVLVYLSNGKVRRYTSLSQYNNV